MDKRGAILEIGEDVLEILDRLRSDDTDTVETAMEEYLKLVDSVYRENAEMIEPPIFDWCIKGCCAKFC